MLIKKMSACAVAGAVVGVVGLSPAPAIAAPATGNVSKGTQYGSIRRGEWRQNLDGSGYWWRTYGSGACTASYSDVDVQWANMASNNSWDKVASWAADFNGCDTMNFAFANFEGELTHWYNYGSDGRSLDGNFGTNNKTVSYQLT